MTITFQVAERRGQRTFVVCKLPAEPKRRRKSAEPGLQERLVSLFSSQLALQAKSMQKDVQVFPSPNGDIFIIVNPPTDAGIVLKVLEDQRKGGEFTFRRVLLDDRHYDSLAVHATQLQMRIRFDWRKLLRPRRDS